MLWLHSLTVLLLRFSCNVYYCKNPVDQWHCSNMDESLADEEVTEVAYVRDEDAEEIIDISSNDVDDENGTGYDNEDTG